MMKKKKLLSMMLLVGMLILSGCSSKEATDASTEDAQATSEETTVQAEGETSAEALDLDYKAGLDANGFFENVAAVDFVENLDYKNIEVPADVHTVEEAAVQAEIDNLLNSFTTSEQVTDRAIVDGDTVNIDYVGSVDGVEFEGGSTGGAGAEVTIGVTSYIDDFLEQLIGHTPGESFDIEVTFPDEYGVETLNGKDAVFAITVNFISETVEPELTDAFVAENLGAQFSWTTVDEMKAGINEELSKVAIRSFIQTDVIAKMEVTSLPEEVLEFQKNAMGNYYMTAAAGSGMTLTDFLTNYTESTTLEEIYEASSEQLTELADYTLKLQAVAEDADIMVTDEALKDFFVNINGTGDYSQYEASYGIEYLKYTVLQELVMDYLAESADKL